MAAVLACGMLASDASEPGNLTPPLALGMGATYRGPPVRSSPPALRRFPALGPRRPLIVYIACCAWGDRARRLFCLGAHIVAPVMS